MHIAHYTTAETVFAHILPTQKLRMGGPMTANDPYEVHYDWFAGRIAMGKSDGDIEGKLKIGQEMRDRISKRLKLLCFSYDEDDWECGNNHHLWTFYASGKSGINTGCCLIFDSEKIKEEVKRMKDMDKWWFDKISYKSGQELSSTVFTESDPLAVFAKKEKRWSNEMEYRLITMRSKDIGNFDYLDVLGCIVGIVVSGDFKNRLTEGFIRSVDIMCKSQVKWFRRVYNIHSHEYDLIPTIA